MTDPNLLVTTPRLTLSHLSPSNPSHCSFMVSLWNTPEFLTMLDNQPTSITTPSAAKTLIENRFIAEHQRNGYGTYLVSLLDDAGQPGTPIGTVSLMRGKESTLLAPDIGFALLSGYMRKGYAVEAAKALMQYVDTELGVKAIFGFCDEGNEASMRLLRRLGLRWEGVREVGEFGGKETAIWSWGMQDIKEYGL